MRMFDSAQRRVASWSSSTDVGRMNQRAGPPMRYQVCFASGTFSSTNFRGRKMGWRVSA